jgi:putative PEP-CTERM system histidine kinase
MFQLFYLILHYLPAISGILAVALAGFVITRDARAGSNRFLSLGLTLLGVYQVLLAFTLLVDATSWYLTIFRMAVGVSAAIPPAWLAFGVIFAEWNGGTHFARWRPAILGLSTVVPLAWAGLATGHVIVPVRLAPYGPATIGVDAWGKAFQAALLVGLALVLLHTENLYRQADDKTRHRIKFLVVGIFTAFTSQIVMLSYTLLYGVLHPWYPLLSALGFLTGEICIAFSLVRHRLLQVDIFVSRYVVYRSLTLALIGGYLIVLGGLAELSQWLNVGLDLATVILLGGLGAAGLTLILLSEQVRRRTQRLLHTHFFRHKYDYRLEWMAAVRRLSHATTLPDIATQTVHRILEVMWVRQAAIYTVTVAPGELAMVHQSGYDQLPTTLSLSPDVVAQMQTMVRLLVSREGQQVPPVMPLGFTDAVGGIAIGMIVPVAALDNLSGILVVGPEISGKPFGVDDWDLLAALAVQAGALIQNARLSQDAADGRQLQVLARLSAFVAHDLKNAVSTLSMLAENASQHMHKPAFQADAVRTLAEVTAKMRNLLTTLSAPRRQTDNATLHFRLASAVEAWTRALADQVPSRIRLQLTSKGAFNVSVDPEQLRSVLSNLVLNAIEAIPGEGFINVETEDEPGNAVFRVSDTGRGMSPEFIRDRLFRPFQTSKPHGLGIGLYQCRHIVQAVNGTLTVESEEGQGTKMVVRLPGVLSVDAAESSLPPSTASALPANTAVPIVTDSATPRREL